MANSLREQFEDILPDLLPTNPEEAINGTELLRKVKAVLQQDYSDGTIRQHFSIMSADPTSPIAKVDQGQGYYRRVLESQVTADSVGVLSESEIIDVGIPEQKRTIQREEKFRAVFIRVAKLNNQFPVHIEHTKGTRQQAGVNKWKFPDVIVLDWEVKQVTDTGLEIDRDLLEVKKSLGEQPFKLISAELKVDLSQSTLRENFFQCVSNSKWAHSAQLVVAGKVSDETLAEQLRRLGTSYDVSVVSYGLDTDYLDSLPPADKIADMGDRGFDEIAGKVNVKFIASGKPRETLDWEHIRDLKLQSNEFNQLFAWIARCLEERNSYSYEEYLELEKMKTKMERIRNKRN